MSDNPGGGWHHYVWYAPDDGAWQLRMYVGDDPDMFGWDECGGGSTMGDEYRLEDPDGDLAAAAVSTSWEKQEGDSWDGYSWDAHPLTATCEAGSSASALSAEGFNEILAGERGWGLQTLWCWRSSYYWSFACSAATSRPRPRRACCRRRERGRREEEDERRAAAQGRHDAGLRAARLARAGARRPRAPSASRCRSARARALGVQPSTPTGAPVYFRAPAGSGRGQTVYVPWDTSLPTPSRRARARTSWTTCRARAPPPPPPPSKTAAPRVASVKVKAPPPHVASVKTAARPRQPPPRLPPPPGMVDLVVPPKAVPGFTRVTKDLPDGRSVEGVVPKGRNRATTSTCPCRPPSC